MNKEHPYDHEDPGIAIDLQGLMSVILKRKWTVLVCTLIVVALVAIGSLLQKPTFTARGRLLIEEEPNILTFEKIYKIDTFSNDYYQTQYEMLKSRTLADNTLKRLNLYENEKYIEKRQIKNGPSSEPDEISKELVIESFLKRLSVKAITNRLVEVSFRETNPRLAADVVNTLFEGYIDMNLQKRYSATEIATDFLNKQIADIKADIEEKEKRLLEYGAQKNIVVLSDKETTIVENLRALNEALAKAQIDRLKKEADYNELRSANPDDIPESLANEVILKLREEQARLNREYVQKSEIYKADFPEMRKLKAELDSVKESLRNETQAMIRAANSDYQAALNKEKSLRDAFNGQKFEANKVKSSAILYNSLKAEIENKKTVLSSLLTRQGETDVSLRLKGLGAGNVSILDRATMPLRPSSPNKKLNIMLAFIVGVLGGSGLAFFFEAMDKSVKNSQDVEKYSRLPVLGIVPAFGLNGFNKLSPGKRPKKRPTAKLSGALISKISSLSRTPMLRYFWGKSRIDKREDQPRMESIELITHFLPKSQISENYRSIRTALFLSAIDSKPQKIAVSSPLPQEGKTTTISNLAVTFAQTGKAVLIIDSDLRKPMLHKIFKMANQHGLTDFLGGNSGAENLVKKTPIANLFLINSGPVPANPLELLSSEKMTHLLDSLKGRFEYVFFDTPPLLLLSDVMALGPKLDGVILVIKGGKTSRGELKQSTEELGKHKIKCLGVVINDADMREHDYYYMKYYHHYYEH